MAEFGSEMKSLQFQRIFKWSLGVLRDWHARGGEWSSRPRFKYLDMDASLAEPVRAAIKTLDSRLKWEDFRKGRKRMGFNSNPNARWGKQPRQKATLPKLNPTGLARVMSCHPKEGSRCFVCGEEGATVKVLDYDYGGGEVMRVHSECKDKTWDAIKRYAA